MFRAVGLIVTLWGLSLFFGSTMRAFDRAATATFESVEVAAKLSQSQMEDLKATTPLPQ